MTASTGIADSAEEALTYIRAAAPEGWAETEDALWQHLVAESPAMLRFVERHFGRWGWAVIAITSNNFVCLVAGATGFSLGWFMVLAVAGTLARLWLFSRQKLLGGNSPASLIQEGKIDAVIEAVERLREGVFI